MLISSPYSCDGKNVFKQDKDGNHVKLSIIELSKELSKLYFKNVSLNSSLRFHQLVVKSMNLYAIPDVTIKGTKKEKGKKCK